MPEIKTRSLAFLSAAFLAYLSFLLTGCSSGSGEKALAKATDAVNAAIEQDLSLDSYEFTVTNGAYLNDEKHTIQVTTYIGVLEDGIQDYYITTTPANNDSDITIEHKLLGNSYYHRIFDKKTGKYHSSSDNAGKPYKLLENGWMLESTGDQSTNEYYKNRLWIHSGRISPEDFTQASRKKEDEKTVISLVRSTNQTGYLPLPAKAMYEEQLEQYKKELAREDLLPSKKAKLESEQQELESAFKTDNKRKYTAEALEAVIDSDGRLLNITYKLTYEAGPDTTLGTLNGEELKSITKYTEVNLERFNDDSIVIPD